MPKITDIETEKTHVGARINKHLVQLLKEAEIPVSDVIESSLIYFLTLSDADKVKFIDNYNLQSARVEDINFPKAMWSDLKEQHGGVL